jgi:prepilin-type N-terminal cleavage/methylation domain-containing protein
MRMTDFKRPDFRRAFTLIELLVVMTIISILLGLVIGIAGPVKKQAAVFRAKTEISAIEVAMTRFEIDNGFFPYAVTLNPTAGVYPGNPQAAGDPYIKASRALFLSLIGRKSLNSTDTNNRGTQYLTDWKENQTGDPGSAADVNPATALSNDPATYTAAGLGAGYSYLKDPFGLAYGYQYDANSAAATGYSLFNQVTYDLWSTAGETKNPTGTDAYIADKWVTNWSQR